MSPSNQVANKLEELKSEILQKWEKEVRASIYVARSETTLKLRDSLPEFLDDLVQALRLGMKELGPDIIRFAHHHGAERAHLSHFSIEDAISEYNILRRVIFLSLEQEVEISPLERDIIFEGLNLGVAKAGAEYVKQQVDGQKKINDQLKESEERFRTLSNALPQIVWTGTPDGYIDWYNDWWYEYLNLPRGTKWDDPITAPMHPEDVIRTRPLLAQSLSTGKTFEMEQRFRRGSDGQYRWHLVRGVPVRDVSGKIYKWVGANTDIHDLKEIQKRLEEETILRDKFVSTLSHDLRTPLSAAKMNAQIIKRKIQEDPAPKLALRIVDNLDRANEMIENLLDASKIRAGQHIIPDIQRIDLVEVVKETLDNLTSIHGDRFQLVSPDSVIADLCPHGMRRIIENLCSNAIKYGSTKDPIDVIIEAGKKYVFLSVHNKANPDFTVDKNMLFEPFKRGTAAEVAGKKGWGIGLTIVKGITEAHQGEVVVDLSSLGTTFKIKLPLKHES